MITQTDKDKFWLRVNKKGPNDCWEWDKINVGDRYGSMWVPSLKRGLSAHRLSYEIHFSHPGKLLVCHSCDNPKCVNPAHLFLGTNSTNSADMKSKGRQAKHEKNGNVKLTFEQAMAVRDECHLLGAGVSKKAIAAKYGISVTHVYYIWRDMNWN